MKPLLWRIAGVSLYALPIAVGCALWAGWDAKQWLINFLIAAAVTASAFAILFIVIGLQSLGDKCFDKAKRPPR